MGYLHNVVQSRELTCRETLIYYFGLIHLEEAFLFYSYLSSVENKLLVHLTARKQIVIAAKGQ